MVDKEELRGKKGGGLRVSEFWGGGGRSKNREGIKEIWKRDVKKKPRSTETACITTEGGGHEGGVMQIALKSNPARIRYPRKDVKGGNI